MQGEKHPSISIERCREREILYRYRINREALGGRLCFKGEHETNDDLDEEHL